MRNSDSLGQTSPIRFPHFSVLAPILLAAFALLPFAVASTEAAQLKAARVSQVIRDVRLLPNQAAPRPASVSDEVRDGTAVRTGVESRAELTFTDATLARLGANTIFSFNEGTRNLELGGGAMLLRVPKDAGGARIQTAAVTAAITGTTIMLEYHPDAYIKFIVLEGTGRIFRNNRIGESVLLHAGQMLIVDPKGKGLPDPVDLDLDRLVQTSLLITAFGPLPSTDLILREIQTQGREESNGRLVQTNLVIFGRGTAVSLLDPTSASTIDLRSPVSQPHQPSENLPPDSPSPNATFNSGTGNWDNPESWTPAFVPNNGLHGLDYNVFVANGTLTQNIATGVTIQKLFMSGGALVLANPLTLQLGLQFSGGTIRGGTLNIAGSSVQTSVMGVSNTILNNSGTYDLAFDSGNAFSGGGSIFNNSGTLIKSTGSGVLLFNIALNNSGNVSVQNGTLQITATGNSAGTFNADLGAILDFSNTYTFNNGATFSGPGTIQFDNGVAAHINGTITNRGTIRLNAGDALTRLLLDDDSTLTGGGTIILASQNSQSNSQVSGAGLLTNTNNTIQGQGNLGANKTQFLNQAAGVINANIDGRTLVVDPNNGGFNNQGLLEASNGGILQLTGNGGGTFTNSGTIKALNGGVLKFDGILTSSGVVDVGANTLTGTGSYTQTAGTFRLAGGSASSSNPFDFEGGLVDAWGTINAAITNNANLKPALGGSGLSVTGNVSLLSASKLTFQLGGLTQGSQYRLSQCQWHRGARRPAHPFFR